MPAYRKEKDVLGTVRVPGGVYYGIETERAAENFRISGIHVQWDLIHAYALLKKSAAMANMKTGELDRKRGRAIVQACDEILAGKMRDQFIVDVFQAGAGTSTNMNLNEVIANRAIELLHGKKGDYKLVHPNDHVNMSQSTNDTFHSATHIAAYLLAEKHLLPALRDLEKVLDAKSAEFSKIIKVGRTHLQEAVPITLGEEFSGYAGAIRESIKSVEDAADRMLTIPLGGTAIGTGINASQRYARLALDELNRLTKAKFRLSKYEFAVMQTQKEEMRLSDSMREAAIALDKIANDFRLLGSGPRSGLNELILPAVQPGSSIMPGKINPSIPEMMNMVAFQVMGSNTTIAKAADAGQLELNVYMPLIAFNLLFSINILSNAVRTFAHRCVSGVKPNLIMIKEHLERDLSIATALSPYIGYGRAAEIARMAYRRNKSVKEICLELNILDRKRLDRILDPRRLV